MQLNTFIANYLPRDVRGTRAFDGDRGWIDLTNLFLRKLEQNKMFHLGRKKEIGVEVDDDYWITLPSNFRSLVEIYYPPSAHYTEKEYKYPAELINGRLKLYVPFDKDASPDSFTLSAGSTTTIKANDTDATADIWKDYLLVLTDGTYSGDTIFIISNTAVATGTTILTFLHTQDNTIDSTTGYLTETFLMMVYMATYTALSAYDDEIPIDDRFESLLRNWLCKEALPVGDKRRKEYISDFKEEWGEAENENFTPTPDQARPMARSLPGYENCSEYENADSDYIGED